MGELLKTANKNIRTVRKAEKQSQTQMGKVLGVSQPYYSEVEAGLWPVTLEYAEIINKKWGYRKSWLLFDEGEPKEIAVENLLNEPAAPYGRKKEIDYSVEGMRVRFAEQVDDVLLKRSSTRRELSKDWHINESHLNNVMNGLRDPSVDMLIKSVRYGNLNLNYTAAGEGGYYVGEGNAHLLKRIGELEMIVEVVKENAALKSGTEKKQRSG